MTGAATVPTAGRVLLWTGRIPDAHRPAGRLRAARQILADSPWATAMLHRDAAGVPRITRFVPTGTASTVPPDGQVSMSWSHSGDDLAVVIADVGPVGIDLEISTGRTPPERELALVLRHARVRLRPAGCDAWCEWTAVEALVKATRCGLIGLITGRLRLVGGREHDPNGATVGCEPPVAVFAVTTRHADDEPGRQQQWQVHHQHGESRRLTVVVPD